MAADPDQDRFRGPDPFGEYEPAYRALRVYAFDPLRGRRGGNHLILRVPQHRAPGGRRRLHAQPQVAQT